MPHVNHGHSLADVVKMQQSKMPGTFVKVFYREGQTYGQQAAYKKYILEGVSQWEQRRSKKEEVWQTREHKADGSSPRYGIGGAGEPTKWGRNSQCDL